MKTVKLKRIVASGARRMKRWLFDDEKSPDPEVPFDNNSVWLRQSFRKVMQDPIARRRPPYVWGVLQGCALGKVLGHKSVSVTEFGVAGGAGLLSLERIAEVAENLIGMQVEVFGFDTGIGLPKSVDYRDCPNLFSAGQFPMDETALRNKLSRAKLYLGHVSTTVPNFLGAGVSPVAFAAFDLDLYSSTRDALKLFDAEYGSLLPRVTCYFDDIIGSTYADFNGERLAIREFNDRDTRKLSPIFGLKYFVPPEAQLRRWPELMYMTHFLEHPRYNETDRYDKHMWISIDGEVGSSLADWPKQNSQEGILK